MNPSFTSISRFVNAISIRCHNASRCMFSHSYIYDVCVAFRNCDCSNRTSFKISIRNIFPELTTVFSFPNSTTSISHIISHWISDDTRCCNRSTSSKRTNVSVLNRFKNTVYRLCEGCCGNKE